MFKYLAVAIDIAFICSCRHSPSVTGMLGVGSRFFFSLTLSPILQFIYVNLSDCAPAQSCLRFASHEFYWIPCVAAEVRTEEEAAVIFS